MDEQVEASVNRAERRKQRTRAALIQAARQFIAEGQLNVAVLQITQAADVGMGSFYNHFQTKEELFEAAVADDLVDRVIEVIEGAARTGKIGDGKIFVYNLEQVVRIRTGETGTEAL